MLGLTQEEPMVTRNFMLIGFFAGLLFISGCSVTTEPHSESLLDRNWGRSHETAIYNQTVNPDSDKNQDPIIGLDGTAAEYNVDKYKESFKETEQREIVNILKLQ
jgi:hypothetical protein